VAVRIGDGARVAANAVLVAVVVSFVRAAFVTHRFWDVRSPAVVERIARIGRVAGIGRLDVVRLGVVIFPRFAVVVLGIRLAGNGNLVVGWAGQNQDGGNQQQYQWESNEKLAEIYFPRHANLLPPGSLPAEITEPG
jgi:hypothetical protein